MNVMVASGHQPFRSREGLMPTTRESNRNSRIAARGRASRAVLLAAMTSVAGSTLAAFPSVAHAEDVSPDGKGIAGAALLGGELVTFGEAIFGVRSTAAYLIGAGAGAVAGGVGGYFIEQAVDDGRVPAYLLAGGLVLLIPAVVVALDATRYHPTEGARDDRPSAVPASDPGKPGGSAVIGAEPAPAPATTPPAETPPGTNPSGGTTPAPAPAGGGGGDRGPQSLLNLNGAGFYMGVPLPEVRPVFTAAQAKQFAVQNSGSELRFPLMRVQF